MEIGLKIEPGSVRSLSTVGMSESGITVQLESGSVPSTVPAQSTQTGQKASLINQIAAQLANSKASQSQSTSPNVSLALGPLSNGNEKSKNPIVATMTEALSLKQSPTLTKQLSKPVSGTSTGMQVITQYMCRYCGQQFESTNDMQLHIQEHVSGKAPHECSVCGKTYRTPSKLQRHVRVHSGERPYACSICGRRFTRSDHVKQHMKVHCQPKDANVCHLCNDMKFSRRQALHLHLQQQHLMQQVFTCHRCGEAFESLEEMQSHKLTHDTVLNSLKDSTSVQPYQNSIAKFALGQQKNEQGMNKYDTIKAEDENKPGGVVLKVPNNNGFYIPANLDNVSALSSKLLIEGMEMMAKEAAELEVQKKYQAELEQLTADAKKFQLDQKKRIEEMERAKIAECFTIKAATPSHSPSLSEQKLVINESSDSSIDIVAGKETTTVVNGDGMSMFILPASLEYGNKDMEKSESEMEADDAESEQNSSKDSVGINREGDGEKSEGDGSERMDCTDDTEEQSGDDTRSKEGKISKSTKIEGYTKPCPKSKKPGYVAPVSQSTETKTVSSEDYQSSSAKPMLSLLNPRINELIKAKVEHNMSHSQNQNQTTFIVTNPAINQQLPKLTFIPNVTGNKYSPIANLPTILPAPSTSTVAFASTGTLPSQPVGQKLKAETPKLVKCEYCCIYFEDNAMSMLHNTLHSADNADPFTCRKCFKKLGNRLEFMAHMVWHLEPNMDI
ncbi:zinc finger protein 236-like [Mercenaria mercenaria]|uniref:zinc finger protein 236-like n=1 Tax=Mercenaria mercenaria TaxID=6596 RepID=UPI00234EE3C0|nr:zinc finger protein 236-like [Mercenaria mercenaria]